MKYIKLWNSRLRAVLFLKKIRHFSLKNFIANTLLLKEAEKKSSVLLFCSDIEYISIFSMCNRFLQTSQEILYHSDLICAQINWNLIIT